MVGMSVVRSAVSAAILLVGILCAGPSPAAPRFTSVNLINQTGQTMTSLFVRRTGTTEWMTLTVTPPRPGRGVHAVAPYSDIDCAFDFRATLEDGRTALWTGVNLCEVKSLSLNRNESGASWVDYD